MSDLTALVEALRPRREALASLWEACTVECPHRLCVNGRYSYGQVVNALCPDCHGDTRIPRTVADWPSGAVAGMLWAATRGNEVSHAPLWVVTADDASALAAVLEAVRAVPEDGE